MVRNPFQYLRSSAPGDRYSRQKSDFDQLEATELYCMECQQAVPVRKVLLLVLPEGDKYEYRCQYCGAKVGDKIDHGAGLKSL
ncbi:cytoplasmic protein [Thermodesulfobacteriota bacterium]